jgi:hypothetical protein
MSNISEKIKKLLNLGERAGTEGEAQAAMSRAHALLAKHNLTLSEVQAHTAEPEEEEVITDESTPAALRNTYWRDTIYGAIGRLYFCKVFMRKGGNRRWYCVVGRPRNIAVVHYVAQYLLRTGEELATQGAKDAARRMTGDGVELNMRAWAASFRIGYASRICERADAEIKKAMASETRDETGTALILSPLYDRENQAIAVHTGDLKLRTRRYGLDIRGTSGFNAGRDAGNRASFASNGVAGSAGVKQISAA